MQFTWPVTPAATTPSLSPHRIVQGDAFDTPGVQTLRVSNWVPVMPGRAYASVGDDGVANEMIHFALLTDRDPGNAVDPPADEDIGITLLFKRGIAPDVVQVASPLATCVSRPYKGDDGTSTVRSFRAACGSVIERMMEGDAGGDLFVAFVVAALRIEDREHDAVRLEAPTLDSRDDYDQQPVGAA